VDPFLRVFFLFQVCRFKNVRNTVTNIRRCKNEHLKQKRTLAISGYIEVLTTALWSVMPCSSLGTNVLEEPATSIFRVKELMCTRPYCATSQNVLGHIKLYINNILDTHTLWHTNPIFSYMFSELCILIHIWERPTRCTLVFLNNLFQLIILNMFQTNNNSSSGLYKQLTVFYHAEIILKLYELSSYKYNLYRYLYIYLYRLF